MDDISLAQQEAWEDFFSGAMFKDTEPVQEPTDEELAQWYGPHDNPDECPHNHVQPRLGYENSFIGEYCTQCGSDLDNYGKIVRYPQSISSKELDRKAGNAEVIANMQNTIGCRTGFPDLKNNK